MCVHWASFFKLHLRILKQESDLIGLRTRLVSFCLKTGKVKAQAQSVLIEESHPMQGEAWVGAAVQGTHVLGRRDTKLGL